MRPLVIHAHPLEASYSAALRDSVCLALGSADDKPDLVRLCQGEQVEATVLRSVEHLVFVYPTWWGGLPAVLLDWVQQTLGATIDGSSKEPSPLCSVQRLSVVTTHGSSRLINTLQGEAGRQLWARTIVGICAPRARFEWIPLYKIDRTEDADRKAFITEAQAAVGVR